MTITSQELRQEYAGEGLVTFEVGFAYQREEDLRVTLLDAEGQAALLSPTTDYSAVRHVDSPGGTLTLSWPLATGEVLVVRRDPAMVQETEYVENDAFPARSHEAALDRLTMIAQTLSDRVDRCLSSDENAPLSDHRLPAPRAGAGLVWNSDANGLESSAEPLADMARTLAVSTADTRADTLSHKLVPGDGLVASVDTAPEDGAQTLRLHAPTLVAGQDPGHTHSGQTAPGNGRAAVSSGDTPGFLQEKFAPALGMNMAVATSGAGEQLAFGPRLKAGGGLRADSSGLYVELSDIGDTPGAHTHEWDDLLAVPSRYAGDLNMLTDCGPYYVTGIASNLPGSRGGFLLVVRDDQDPDTVLQQFTEAVAGGRTWQRQRTADGWQPWLQMNTSGDAELPAAHRLNRMEYYAVQLRVQMSGGVLQHSFLGHLSSGNPLEYAGVILQPSMTLVNTPLLDGATGFVGGAGVLAADPRKLLLDVPDIDGIPLVARPSLVGRLQVRQTSFLPGGMPPRPFVSYSTMDDVAGDLRTRVSLDLRDYAGNSVNWTDMPDGAFLIMHLDGYTTPDITQ